MIVEPQSEAAVDLDQDVMVESKTGLVRTSGAILQLIAILMFIGAFIAAERTPATRPTLPKRCEHQACDAGSSFSERQAVFYRWLGVTLVVLIGGTALRATGARRSDE
jgi:hypothetical protein